VAIAVDLMDLPTLTVANSKESIDASVGTDRDARINRLDVAAFREKLELYEPFGQRVTDAVGITPRMTARRRRDRATR
jgi:hypothetical protein